MSSNSVDPKILEKSPLTPSQKEILRRIDIQKESTTNVAKDFHVSTGTMSIRHKTALRRYNEFAALFREIVADEVEKFRGRLEVLESKMDDAFLVLDSNDKYLRGLRFIVDQIGPFRVENCVHNAGDKCTKWPSRLVGPSTCAFCTDFLDKHDTEVLVG